MKNLTIGTRVDGHAAFHLDASFITESCAILAKRGMGKSYLGAVLAEELLESGQVPIIIDLTGAHWGLKSSANGKEPGYPIVVFGGDHADIPLEENAGELIADALVERRFACILDLSLFRKNQVYRFLADFLETLYRKNRQAVHLICDEADAYAPQNVRPETARVLGAMEDIIRRGRIRGIGCTLITQRPQVINKNVLTQCAILLAMRLVHPKDINAVMEWVNVNADENTAKRMMAALPTLPVGHAWFWAPGWNDLFAPIKIRQRHTYDSGATPKPGETRIAPSKLSVVDVEKLGKEIAATVQKAKENDPTALKARIRELEKAAPKESIPVTKVVEIPMLTKDEKEMLSAFMELVRAIKFENITDLLNRILNKQTSRAIVLPAPTRPFRSSVERHSVTPISNGDSPTGGMRRMMIALAQRPGLNKRQIGVRAGLSSSSGTFGTYMGKLRSSGWISENGNDFELTREGVDALGSYQPLPEGRELLEYWLRELGGGGEGRMLRVLAECYPASMSAERLGEEAQISPTSGTFGTYLGHLRTLELITGNRESLKASEELS